MISGGGSDKEPEDSKKKDKNPEKGGLSSLLKSFIPKSFQSRSDTVASSKAEEDRKKTDTSGAKASSPRSSATSSSEVSAKAPPPLEVSPSGALPSSAQSPLPASNVDEQNELKQRIAGINNLDQLLDYLGSYEGQLLRVVDGKSTSAEYQCRMIKEYRSGSGSGTAITRSCGLREKVFALVAEERRLAEEGRQSSAPESVQEQLQPQSPADTGSSSDPSVPPKESSQASLLEAAKKGDIDAVKKILLEQQVDVNAVDSDGNTPLHLAVLNENIDIVNQLLLRPDVDVNKQDSKGCTALHYAVLHNNFIIVEALLMHSNMDLSKQNLDGILGLPNKVPDQILNAVKKHFESSQFQAYGLTQEMDGHLQQIRGELTRRAALQPPYQAQQALSPAPVPSPSPSVAVSGGATSRRGNFPVSPPPVLPASSPSSQLRPNPALPASLQPQQQIANRRAKQDPPFNQASFDEAGQNWGERWVNSRNMREYCKDHLDTVPMNVLVSVLRYLNPLKREGNHVEDDYKLLHAEYEKRPKQKKQPVVHSASVSSPSSSSSSSSVADAVSESGSGAAQQKDQEIYSWTALHGAAYEGNFNKTSDLLRQGFDPNVKDPSWKWIPLQHAMYQWNEEDQYDYNDFNLDNLGIVKLFLDDDRLELSEDEANDVRQYLEAAKDKGLIDNNEKEHYLGKMQEARARCEMRIVSSGRSTSSSSDAEGSVFFPSPITPQRQQYDAPKDNFELMVDEITRAHFQDEKKWNVVGGKRETDKKDFTLEKKRRGGEEKQYSACVEKQQDGGCVFKVSNIDKKDEKAVIREICRIAVEGAQPGSRFDLTGADPTKAAMIAGILKEEIKRAQKQVPNKFPGDADDYIVRTPKTAARPGQ